MAPAQVQVPLAEHDEVVEQFLLQRLNETLDVGHSVRRAVGSFLNPKPFRPQLVVERS